ncbi:hypothetical protein H4Q26_000300 [Puccinia striiformis f. sp. tritici PST-130]|nr:hypothetical protein H4Q26_000300 [Puccinia striiformis f. sp. tritici PST-130]
MDSPPSNARFTKCDNALVAIPTFNAGRPSGANVHLVVPSKYGAKTTDSRPGVCIQDSELTHPCPMPVLPIFVGLMMVQGLSATVNLFQCPNPDKAQAMCSRTDGDTTVGESQSSQ